MLRFPSFLSFASAMSVSPEFMGQKTATPDKPSFKRTCSLLSQYLKEKGGFGDLTLGMTGNVESNVAPEVVRPTMSLFPMDQISSGNVGGPRSVKSMDLFPRQDGFSMPAAPTDNAPKRVNSIVNSSNKCAAMEPQSAPMTIFYGGQVMVFNDFPAEKAKEIMLLATKCSSQNNFNLNPETNITSSMPGTPNESGIVVPPTSNGVPNLRNNVTSQESIQPAQQRSVAGDLPIARRASLHRFLEKRKDRITSKGPYQASNSAAGSQSKPGNSKPWLGLAVEPLQ
ncbi:glycoside hydrolase family 28 family protein [Hibiscus syriacus]|uniref:Protein TIFY n=1 Tax=Hibiscus syriacus TaxID=106335 RepID=A0A6A3A5K6_HIBSY|nr:protein TIFY 10A-like [Hibiscus syriacus]KAE8698409.1 glycoside hydrolase family 28 family protein [Hibiscus syriacus]